MTQEQLTRYGKNLIKFTAPTFAVFFAQLALGVDPKKAFLVAILAFYGAMADLMKKVSE